MRGAVAPLVFLALSGCAAHRASVAPAACSSPDSCRLLLEQDAEGVPGGDLTEEEIAEVELRLVSFGTEGIEAALGLMRSFRRGSRDAGSCALARFEQLPAVLLPSLQEASDDRLKCAHGAIARIRTPASLRFLEKLAAAGGCGAAWQLRYAGAEAAPAILRLLLRSAGEVMNERVWRSGESHPRRLAFCCEHLAGSLGSLGTRSTSVLVGALESGSWRVAFQAARALANHPAAEAQQALRGAALGHWSSLVREAAAWALRTGVRKRSMRTVAADWTAANAEIKASRCAYPWKRWLFTRSLDIRHGDQVSEISNHRPSEGPRPPGPLRRGSSFRTPDGWLIAIDGGEWGGSLVHLDELGRRTVLLEDNAFDILEGADGILALAGGPFSHGLYRVSVSEEGRWTAEPVLHLPGTALAWGVTKDGALVIAADYAAIALKKGRITELPCQRLAQQGSRTDLRHD